MFAEQERRRLAPPAARALSRRGAGLVVASQPRTVGQKPQQLCVKTRHPLRGLKNNAELVIKRPLGPNEGPLAEIVEQLASGELVERLLTAEEADAEVARLEAAVQAAQAAQRKAEADLAECRLHAQLEEAAAAPCLQAGFNVGFERGQHTGRGPKKRSVRDVDGAAAAVSKANPAAKRLAEEVGMCAVKRLCTAARDLGSYARASVTAVTATLHKSVLAAQRSCRDRVGRAKKSTAGIRKAVVTSRTAARRRWQSLRCGRKTGL